MAQTSSEVNIITPNNVTLEDAFKFGTDGDTTWSFTNQNFRMDIKGSAYDDTALLSLTSGVDEIVVDNAITRVLHLNLDEATLQAALVPGCYVYDLVMYDNSTPAVRVVLMHGKFIVTQGVTGG